MTESLLVVQIARGNLAFSVGLMVSLKVDLDINGSPTPAIRTEIEARRYRQALFAPPPTAPR